MNDKEGKLLVYNLPNGKAKVDVLLSQDNIWMTRIALADLYQTTPQNITMHIKNIYQEGELDEFSTSKSDLLVQIEGNREVKRNINFYNLDMIIAIGFRAKSSIGNTFRRWANQTLKEYMIKGFAMDDERLKNSSRFGKDYFDELLDRIRSIRASAKRFYQKIIEIYSTSIDYSSNDENAKLFFKTDKINYIMQ